MQSGSLGVAMLAVFCLAGCEDEYSLAPTPCDDYCLATQRAGCPDDWPDDCVRNCEFTVSPTSYPDCADEFASLLGCYQALSDREFTCEFDESTPLPGRCESEEETLNFCTNPVLHRCNELCGRWNDRCENFDPNICFQSCSSSGDECVNERVRWLDCELAHMTACETSLPCEALSFELSICLYS